MNPLEQSLNKALANTFTFYLKLQNFHWNCEGPDFFQTHKLYEEIYTDVYGAIDPLAEHIRACGYYAVGTMAKYLELTDIVEVDLSGKEVSEMSKNLLEANDKLIISLYQAYEQADGAKELGLANFIQDRIDMHNKHSWFLKSQTK